MRLVYYNIYYSRLMCSNSSKGINRLTSHIMNYLQRLLDAKENPVNIRATVLLFLPLISHTSSTINSKDLAVDPLAILRSEETDDTGNVNGEADPV